MASQIKKSDGTVLNASTNPLTNRKLVKNGQATVVTPGVSGFDVVQLKSSSVDTQFTSATAQVPIALGVGDVRFTPEFYPEKF